MKYSNQIWMDGQDYAYAEVPSISMRDAAMTYRDYVLYEDFRIKNLWFPMANLMTHGIIKGALERLGGEDDPLDKFTDDVVLYLARGVSMWELYITPDVLTDGEWNALAQAIKWAKDRFPILTQTEMVGRNPKKREPYGYVHFKGNRAIVLPVIRRSHRFVAVASSRLLPSCSWPESLTRAACSREKLLNSLRGRSPRLRYHGRTGEYVLVDAELSATGSPIVITQNDVRAIQLAKAALYTGAKLLMAERGVDRVDRVVLAGAFGSFISPLHALVLGLIPDCPLDRVVAVGNAAGDGARFALLNRNLRLKAADLARGAVHVSTPLSASFQDEFVAALGLPHASDPFPTLEGILPE